MTQPLTKDEPPSRAEKRDPGSHKTATGALINLSGRQRMLSHRVVMFLALAQMQSPGPARDAPLASAKAALKGFSDARRILVEGDQEAGLPPASGRARELLHDAVAAGNPRLTGLGLLDGFVAQSEHCIIHFHRADETLEHELLALSGLVANDLLAFLNRLVAAFEADLAEAEAAEASAALDIRQFVSSTLDDIERLGVKMHMIAVNAVIEAARAGEAGRAFAFVANEIKALSAQAREEAAKIGQAMDRLFDR
jgi:hypothetical protein